MRSFAATVIITLLGVSALWIGTDGFQAFTTEAARRLSVTEHPRELPDTLLEDQDGKAFSLASYRGKLVLVDFFYTRCTGLCPELEESMEQIAEGLSHRLYGRDIALLSISIDPEDTPAELAAYAERIGADAPAWRFARAADAEALKALLKSLGIVVIADASGNLDHNASIHLIDRHGRLVRIFDPDAPQRIVKAISEGPWLSG